MTALIPDPILEGKGDFAGFSGKGKWGCAQGLSS
jgi:hypothetical protein